MPTTNIRSVFGNNPMQGPLVTHLTALDGSRTGAASASKGAVRDGQDGAPGPCEQISKVCPPQRREDGF